VTGIAAAVAGEDRALTILLRRDGSSTPAPAGMTVADLRGSVKLYWGFDPCDCLLPFLNFGA
jgi:hypothetical protein